MKYSHFRETNNIIYISLSPSAPSRRPALAWRSHDWQVHPGMWRVWPLGLLLDACAHVAWATAIQVNHHPTTTKAFHFHERQRQRQQQRRAAWQPRDPRHGRHGQRRPHRRSHDGRPQSQPAQQEDGFLLLLLWGLRFALLQLARKWGGGAGPPHRGDSSGTYWGVQAHVLWYSDAAGGVPVSWEGLTHLLWHHIMA